MCVPGDSSIRRVEEIAAAARRTPARRSARPARRDARRWWKSTLDRAPGFGQAVDVDASPVLDPAGAHERLERVRRVVDRAVRTAVQAQAAVAAVAAGRPSAVAPPAGRPRRRSRPRSAPAAWRRRWRSTSSACAAAPQARRARRCTAARPPRARRARPRPARSAARLRSAAPARASETGQSSMSHWRKGSTDAPQELLSPPYASERTRLGALAGERQVGVLERVGEQRAVGRLERDVLEAHRERARVRARRAPAASARARSGRARRTRPSAPSSIRPPASRTVTWQAGVAERLGRGDAGGAGADDHRGHADTPAATPAGPEPIATALTPPYPLWGTWRAPPARSAGKAARTAR